VVGVFFFLRAALQHVVAHGRRRVNAMTSTLNIRALTWPNNTK
jgi:hypothetical protein